MNQPVPSGRPLVVLDALLVNRHPTGVGRSILELLPALATKDRGLDFLVLATEPAMFSNLEGISGWQVLPCPGARGGTVRKALFTQTRVPGICLRNQAALLHSLQFVAPLRLPCPSVVTVHDLAWLRFPDTVEEPRRSYYRIFVPRTLARAGAIVTNSQSTADDTVHFYRHTRAKITPTFFGTPSWVWQQKQVRPPEKSVRPFFLFVGTLEPRKNLERLLEAYDHFLKSPEAAARSKHEIPSLLFVGGKGWKDSRLQSRIQDFCSRGHLEVRDYCGIEELWSLYRSAKALLFPSLHEGFGFPILEALAAELPVLTSNRGAMAEVGGQDVLAVDPEDPLDIARGLAVIAWNHSLRRELVAGGILRAASWSWERTADLTAHVYHELLVTESNK